MFAQKPYGWTDSFVDTTLTISPESSASTTYSVTSASNSTSGDYLFTNFASDNSQGGKTGSGTTTYTVL